MLVIHHSADVGTFDSIKAAHVQRGYRTIGYNAVVDRDALLHVGRPVPQTPAANSKRNMGTLAICLIGDNTRDDRRWTEHQIDVLCRYVLAARMIWPEIEVLGHRDLSWATTECPGLDVRELLDHRGVQI